MVMNKRKVTLQVGSNFFDNLFEPSRKQVEKQLGTRVSQAAFSDMLVESKVSLNVKLNKEMFLNGRKKGKKKK